MDELRPLKPMVDLPQPWWGWALALAGVALAFAWVWWRRGRGRPALPSPLASLGEAGPVGVPMALALQRLQGQGWLGAGPLGLERHAHALAALLRAWLGARFAWQTLGLTTQELLALLAHAPLPEGGQPQARDLLLRLDGARFGDRPLEAQALKELQVGAGWLVEALGEAEVPDLSPEAWALRSERELAS